MDMGLRGRTAVVTGASRGIGLAVARALVAEGAMVVAGSRASSAQLDELVAGGQAESVLVDLAGPKGPAELVARAAEVAERAGGRIDVLVNNVGGAPPRLDGFLAVTDEQWLDSINLNLMAAVRMTRAVLPHMLAAGRGSIVTVSSVNAFLPDPAVIDYSAAKGALTNFSKSLSKEVAAHGIRVNTVSPGPVATDLWLGSDGVAARIGRKNGVAAKDVAAGAAADAATGRFSRPDEVADLVVLLAGERAGNVTGADITIDGGLIKTL
ncbi:MULTISPECIES: SDR family NAD(P)-dependent oxidoreductase [unclassified Pseudofrankia]|uniref:SDR family NAD(P)-dependent oxidoreductase n=1 Tax=unclassified Pseudofrankia TaxID=2994372 RepID=UPI0008D8F34D|nr:3-oxoacyl-ACP reductase [Pseudofrankia sp. BMG5.36]